MTRIRQRILDMLCAAGQPLSAASVFRLLEDDCDQATVYRTLHYLEAKGLAESFIFHCDEHGTERYFCALGDGASHRHWFHCQSCHRFIDIGACTVNGLAEYFEKEQRCLVKRHILYFLGICEECGKQRNPGADKRRPKGRSSPETKQA